MHKRLSFLFFSSLTLLLLSCSTSRKLSVNVDPLQVLLDDSTLRHAHVGVHIMDLGSGATLYQHNKDKYFVPASNVKILTCYAAMKFLGDSVPAAHLLGNDSMLMLVPTGDPSLLHPDFNAHPLIERLKNDDRNLVVYSGNWKDHRWGPGWAWNDYVQSYMTEKSPLPVFGNQITWFQEREETDKPAVISSQPEIDWPVDFLTTASPTFKMDRSIDSNHFFITEGKEKRAVIHVPFVTRGAISATYLLGRELNRKISISDSRLPGTASVVYSQPLDTVLRLMMHRSDNFIAEQLLLMVGGEKQSVLQTSRAIDLVQSAWNLSPKPRWVDGSGLSRYNLVSPSGFTTLLSTMKNEFDWKRISSIFATGNQGTLTNYYRADSTFIYAKTGTLSGVVALSGYLRSVKGNWMVFSVIVNNHNGSAVQVRRRVEAFLQGIRQSN